MASWLRRSNSTASASGRPPESRRRPAISSARARPTTRIATTSSQEPVVGRSTRPRASASPVSTRRRSRPPGCRRRARSRERATTCMGAGSRAGGKTRRAVARGLAHLPRVSAPFRPTSGRCSRQALVDQRDRTTNERAVLGRVEPERDARRMGERTPATRSAASSNRTPMQSASAHACLSSSIARPPTGTISCGRISASSQSRQNRHRSCSRGVGTRGRPCPSSACPGSNA